MHHGHLSEYTTLMSHNPYRHTSLPDISRDSPPSHTGERQLSNGKIASRLMHGDVIDYRTLHSIKVSQSLSNVLAISYRASGAHDSEAGDPVSHDESQQRLPWTSPRRMCPCGACTNVFSLSVSHSGVVWDPSRLKCSRVSRLDDQTRLQEMSCWKCRLQCWENYSLSKARRNNQSCFHPYQRKPHRSNIRLPPIDPKPDPSDTSLENLPPTHPPTSTQARRGQGLGRNLLPPTVANAVFGITCVRPRHYHEKSGARMRWLLVQANLSRLVRMSKAKTNSVQNSFRTLILAARKERERQAEVERMKREVEERLRQEQIRKNILKKLRLEKVRKKFGKALDIHANSKKNKLQAAEEQFRAKVNAFKEKIKSDQTQICRRMFDNFVLEEMSEAKTNLQRTKSLNDAPDFKAENEKVIVTETSRDLKLMLFLSKESESISFKEALRRRNSLQQTGNNTTVRFKIKRKRRRGNISICLGQVGEMLYSERVEGRKWESTSFLIELPNNYDFSEFELFLMEKQQEYQRQKEEIESNEVNVGRAKTELELKTLLSEKIKRSVTFTADEHTESERISSPETAMQLLFSPGGGGGSEEGRRISVRVPHHQEDDLSVPSSVGSTPCPEDAAAAAATRDSAARRSSGHVN